MNVALGISPSVSGKSLVVGIVVMVIIGHHSARADIGIPVCNVAHQLSPYQH